MMINHYTLEYHVTNFNTKTLTLTRNLTFSHKCKWPCHVTDAVFFAYYLSGKHFNPTSCGLIRNQRSKIRRSNITSTSGCPFWSRNSSVEWLSTLASIKDVRKILNPLPHVRKIWPFTGKINSGVRICQTPSCGRPLWMAPKSFTFSMFFHKIFRIGVKLNFAINLLFLFSPQKIWRPKFWILPGTGGRLRWGPRPLQKFRHGF